MKKTNFQFSYMGEINIGEEVNKIYKDVRSEEKNKFCGINLH
jgi:hypothetical protein